MNIPNQLGNLRPTLTAGWRRLAASAAAQSLSTRPWRNGLFGLFLAAILAYGVFFAWYLLVSFDLLNLIRAVNYDDSYYYFQIARNLAAGQFSTFDGGITQTNGYHPLWLLLITPFYWVMDGETALFGIKAFEIILIAGAALLIVAAARLTGQPWLLLFALLPLLYQNRTLFSGMETAPALFMLGLLFPALALYARNPARWQWLLAAVAFLLPWARLEYIAISLTATAAMGAMALWRSEPAGDAAAGGGLAAWRSRIAPAMFIPFLGAVAGILVYFAYNGLVFDGLVPVSGAVKNAWSQQRWDWEGGYNLFRNFGEVLQIPVFGYELLIALEVCVYGPLVWWLARRSGSRQDWLLLAFLAGALSLGVGHTAKFIQTVLTVHPEFQGEFPWYFVPAYLLTALIIPVRCFVALYLIRRFIGSRRPGMARLLSAGVVVITAALLLVRADFTEPFRYAASSNAIVHQDQWAAAGYMGVQVANRTLPEGSVIGSWDAGVIAYFSRFPVVNLDGVVNSYDYFREIRAKVNRPGDSGEFFALDPDWGLTHLANIRATELENTVFQGTLDASGRVMRVGAVAPTDAAADAVRLWAGLSPHFDYQEGDVGLMVESRVALAVVRNCPPEEIIVWSWHIPGARPAFQPGMNTGRRPGGLCISEAVLPAAAAVDSARVTTMPAEDYLARLRASRLPALRSRYDVYLTENNLIYAKEQCVDADRSRFLLHLYPVNIDALPEWSRPNGFANRDFEFRTFGTQVGGICLANVPLPGAETARIRTGQFTENSGVFTNLWVEEIPTNLSYDERLARVDLQKASVPPRDYLAMLTADREPLIRADYDVYLVENRLIYAKEQCRPESAAANFFLHVYPRDPETLPEVFQQAGFDNRDFDFQQYGVQADGMCLVNVPLPSQDIVRIRTGQFVKVGGDFSNLWEEDVWTAETPP